MSDDLLTTVKKALDEHDRFPDERAYDSDSECDCAMCVAAMAGDESLAVNWLGALLARCEAAEGCDGDCACVVLSRHEWQRAYSEERLKREAAEAERDALRIENVHLREAFVTMEWAANERERERDETHERNAVLVAEVRRLREELDRAPGIDLCECDITVRKGEALWRGPRYNILTLHGYRIEPMEHHGQSAAIAEGSIAGLERDLLGAIAELKATCDRATTAEASYDKAQITIAELEVERDHYRQDYAHHLCHPAHTTDSSDGGVCVHCGRTLLAQPMRREP